MRTVRRKLPLTNLASHSVVINFWTMNNFEFGIFRETGHVPIAFGDEEFPSENSVFQDQWSILKKKIKFDSGSF